MKNLIVLILFICFSSYNVLAQQGSFVDNRLKADHTVESTINGRAYQLYVSLPSGYSKQDSLQYPVLYYLDGQLIFYSIHGTRIVLDLGGEIEQVIIIGISSGTDQISWFNERWADYTPSYYEEWDLKYQIGIPSGGASKFLEVLKDEIIPFVDGYYNTNDDRGIAGNSLGGLFSAYCLFKAPDLFNRFGINSASFFWQDKELLKMEKSFSESHTNINANVFVSVGSLEVDEDDMIINLHSFCDNLKSRNYEGLNITCQVFEDETHFSVVPASASRTLTALYGVKVE